MTDPRTWERRRARVALGLFYAGILGFGVCIVTLGADGWAYAYACFVAGWIAWLELSPESAVNRRR